MDRSSTVACLALLFCACGDEHPTSSAATSATSEPSVHAATPAPAPVTQAPVPSASELPNPCAAPGPLSFEIEAGVIKKTPWGLELTYAVDEDKKRGPGYMFLLHAGSRRWETRRDPSNWNKRLNWRGFCWRGADRPEHRSQRVRVEIAPVCKDGALIEVGSCGTALGPH